MNDITVATSERHPTGWSIGISVLMIAAGVLAIALPQVAGIAINLVVAWLLVFSGMAHLAYAWHSRTTGGSTWEILLGALYAGIGAYMLFHPLAGLATLTLVLAIYLFFEGVLELVLSLIIRPIPGWGWLMADGIITLILGGLIWTSWPSSAEWIIGTLVGISILLSGITRLMISLARRSARIGAGTIRSPQQQDWHAHT